MTSLTDARGEAIHIDAYLIDDRGRVYKVLPTEGGIVKERIVKVALCSLRRGKVVPHDRHTYLRTYTVFVVTPNTNEKANKELYWALYDTHVRQRSRDSLRQRKGRILHKPS